MHDQHEESKDSLSMLKSNYHHTGTAAAHAMMLQNGANANNYNASQSFFLNTNASIFERNPFQDFTASKINALLNVNGGTTSSAGATSNGGQKVIAPTKPSIEHLV